MSYLTIGNVEEYTQWEYETACGIPVTLAMGPDKALIIADLPDAYLVRVGDVETGEAAMPGEVLEAMADAFRFDAV